MSDTKGRSGVRHLGGRGWRRGQIAIATIPILAFLLMFVLITVNTGQMAIVRVETSNAADAAALAGASWMASGENECAWIARKIWDSAALLEADYLVPFLHGAPATFARDLGTYVRNLIRTSPPPSGFSFGQVCDGAMLAARNRGLVATLEASANNMIARSNTNLAGGSVFNALAQQQGTLYSKGKANKPIGGSNVGWVNEKPAGEGYLEHTPSYDLGGFPAAPELKTTSRTSTYLVFNGSQSGSHFNCAFSMQHVIVSPPAADFSSFPDMENRPLDVDTDGYKNWDVNLATFITRLWPSNQGSSLVCDVEERERSLQVPSSITNGSGAVSSDIQHGVQTCDGCDYVGLANASWAARFPMVGSTAGGSFTSAKVSYPPSRDARARLSSAN